MALTQTVPVDVRRSARIRAVTAPDTDQQEVELLSLPTVYKKVPRKKLPLSSVRGPVQPQSISPFFKLPAELRNYIYELALPTTFELPGTTRTLIRRKDRVLEAAPFKPDRKPKGPGFLLSCKHIYGEAIMLYISTCTFLIPDPRVLCIWFQGLSPTRISLLRNIHYTNEESDYFYEERARVMPHALKELFDYGDKLYLERSILSEGTLKVKLNGAWIPLKGVPCRSAHLDMPFVLDGRGRRRRRQGKSYLERKYRFEAREGSTVWKYYEDAENGVEKSQRRGTARRVNALTQPLF